MALKNYAKSILSLLYKWNNKAKRQNICFQHGLLDITSPLLRPIAQGKKKSGFLKILLLFFTELKQKKLQFVWKHKRPQITKTILR